MATVTTSMPFDNTYVFDRLPLSHEQKMALIKQLTAATDKTKIVGQCQNGTTDSGQTGASCAVDQTPPPLPAESAYQA